MIVKESRQRYLKKEAEEKRREREAEPTRWGRLAYEMKAVRRFLVVL